MDINLLTLNVGNSRLAIGVFAAGELQYSVRVSHEQRNEWPGRLAEAWARIKDLDQPAVVGATVNPALIEPLEHAVQQATKQEVQWVGREVDLPIKVLTDKPEETGVDRVLNIAAAYEQLGKACVVVDAGTATPAEIAGLDLEGALALVRRSDAIPVAEQSNNAAAAGARLVALAGRQGAGDP